MCRRRSTETIAMLASIVVMSGCATHAKPLLPQDSSTMLEVWQRNTGGGAGTASATRKLLDARATLRRPLTERDSKDARASMATYTRDAQHEIEQQFHRLPNPDLVMFVFPHVAGSLHTPIPGYSTVFALHERIEYAMPGERTQEY